MKPRIVSTLISIGIITILYVAVKSLINNTYSKRMYANFGIRIPNGYATHGIDVSRYQQDIDWDLVSKMKDQGVSISFGIIKSTEGIHLIDPKYKANRKNVEKTGITNGAYHYFRANVSGAQQAKFFILNTNLKSGDIAPVVDIEEANGVDKSKLQQALKECLDVLENKYNCKPIIYSGATFYTNYLENTFDDYPLWVAHYNVGRPRLRRDWDIWQHSDRGNVNGIDGKVDFNVFKGNSMQFARLLIP